MNIYLYILIWVCILGLCLGSFYNVVILRSLNNESIVFPPSKCPKCGHKLYWWHNIPVLSYILLRGKCYFCKEKISIQYPIVELITMVLFGLAYMRFGISIKTLFVMFWLSCLIIMTGTDIKEKLVDCNIAIGMAVLGVIYNGLANGWNGVLYSVLGLLASALIIEIIARLGYLVVKTRAMGEADTYVAGALGAVFGIYNIVPVLLAGFLFSMVFVIPVFLYNRFKANDKATCILSIIFTLAILVEKKLWENGFTLSLVVITGLALAFFIIRTLGKAENRNYLPYVPALASGALFWFFV